jgi:hypothetical protein
VVLAIYPHLKSVKREINFKLPTRRVYHSFGRKHPLPSPTKAREWETQAMPIAPRGEWREKTKELQPHTPKATWGAHSQMHHKIAIPSIKIVAQIMWYGHPIHEALAIQQGKPIFKETRSNEEFVNMGKPLTEIEESQTLHRAIMRVHQCLYPHERPDAIPGHRLNFTQLPKQCKRETRHQVIRRLPRHYSLQHLNQKHEQKRCPKCVL